MKKLFERFSIVLSLIWAVALFGWEFEGQGQSTFVNLDFEHPVLPLVPGPVALSSAFPGWSAYSAQGVAYDTVSLGASAVSLHDLNGAIPILEGNYTAALQPNYPSGDVVPALGQVGTVPATARSVRFYGNGNYILSYGGQPIPLVVLASLPNYNIFGGDISAFINQTAELRIQGGGSLDNISFSDLPIPEPSAIGLFGLGTLFLGWWLRKNRSAN